MNKLSIILILFLSGCSRPANQNSQETKTEVRWQTINETISVKMQTEVDKLLAEDKANKMLELEYLEQIRIAQENNDTEAFQFFLQEYVEVDRLEIPEELKKEPNYFQGGNKVKY